MEVDPRKFRPYKYPFELNMPIPAYYEKNADGSPWVDPLFRQYTRKPCDQVGPFKASALLRPELIRRHRGQIFQKKFPADPCPMGWSDTRSLSPAQQESFKQYPESDIRGYCVPQAPEFEPVLYTKDRRGSWFLNTPMMNQDFLPVGRAPPLSKTPNEQRDWYGYLTNSGSPYKRDTEGYSMLYSP